MSISSTRSLHRGINAANLTDMLIDAGHYKRWYMGVLAEAANPDLPSDVAAARVSWLAPAPRGRFPTAPHWRDLSIQLSSIR